MNSFAPGYFDHFLPPHGLVRTIRLVGEYHGKEDLFRRQSPQALETLRQAAVIQSTESSNRIEGVTAPRERIELLVLKKARPRDRSEQEIAGYRDVLTTIHSNHGHMPFTVGLVQQLHRDLFKFTPDPGGQWKSVNNEIAENRPDGTRAVRFKPVEAHLTEDAMRTLHERFRAAWDAREVDPLLLIPAYVLDFLCIHPFRDGNGRMGRLLSLLLLYQAGYELGRYVSLELIVEETKDGYYDTLRRSSEGWHEGQHSLLPWTDYFLGVMLLRGYREFERRAGVLTSARGAKTAMILEAVEHMPESFGIADLERVCPNVTRDMLRVVLNRLKKEKRLRCEGRGPMAVWRKTVNTS